jgi:hypothetical protein
LDKIDVEKWHIARDRQAILRLRGLQTGEDTYKHAADWITVVNDSDSRIELGQMALGCGYH